MNWFKRVGDWATNNSVNYEKENNVYTEIVNEIESINHLLDIAITSDFAASYPFTFDGMEMTLSGLKMVIEMQKNKMFHIENDLECQKIQEEVKRLEEAYRDFCEIVKDTFLRLKELYEVQEHVFSLDKVIYQNAHYEAFKNVKKGNELLTKQWTIKELENLRNEIANRRGILIPYLGQMQRRK